MLGQTNLKLHHISKNAS